MAPGKDDFFDFTGGGADDRTAVVDLSELGGARRSGKPDRHLLVGVHGTLLGRVRRLGPTPLRIGRNQDSELWLDDNGVSRRHAQIQLENGAYILEDLESANGTFVQGQQVKRHLLHDGDVIQFGPSAVFRYSVADKDQEEMLVQLYAASVTDALTGAHNREYFNNQLAAELSYSRRHRTEVSLLLFDIDHFKRVNDTYGHPAGDSVLIEISRSVRKVVRNEDVFARYGGEEFAIVLRAIDVHGAARAAERLREVIQAMSIDSDRRSIQVTISIGCASVSECEDPQPDHLIALADRRLYAAKNSGRNRVVADG